MTTEISLPLSITGAGGFSREVLCQYIDIHRGQGCSYHDLMIFAEKVSYWQQRNVMENITAHGVYAGNPARKTS